MKLLLNLHGFIMEHEIDQNTAPRKIYVPVYYRGNRNISEVLTNPPKINDKKKPVVMYEFKFMGYKPTSVAKKDGGFNIEDVGTYEAVTMHRFDQDGKV